MLQLLYHFLLLLLLVLSKVYFYLSGKFPNICGVDTVDTEPIVYSVRVHIRLMIKWPGPPGSRFMYLFSFLVLKSSKTKKCCVIVAGWCWFWYAGLSYKIDWEWNWFLDAKQSDNCAMVRNKDMFVAWILTWRQLVDCWLAVWLWIIPRRYRDR